MKHFHAEDSFLDWRIAVQPLNAATSYFIIIPFCSSTSAQNIDKKEVYKDVCLMIVRTFGRIKLTY